MSSEPITQDTDTRDTLLRLARAVSAPVTEHFVEDLAHQGTAILGMPSILIGLLDQEGQHLKPYLLLDHGRRRDLDRFAIDGTPHERVFTDGSYLVQENASQLYPRDDTLAESQAQCYAGAPLVDSKERVIGLFAAFGPEPFDNPSLVRSIISILASRIAVEISRQQLEQRFVHAMRFESIGKLAGGVAHDFNNLLTVILSGTEYVLETLGPGHPAIQDLEDVRDAGRRAADLTRQLLAFSRQQYLDRKTLELNELIRGVEKMLCRVIVETIQVELDLDDKPLTVFADPGHIEQVLLNLAVNARDAMPDGGRLSIRTRQHGNQVEIRVSDTGPGVPDKYQDRIFEPFFTTAEPGQGSGLGLAAVYGIVNQNNGTIELVSSPGQGACFRILLPCSADQPGTGDAPFSQQPGTQGTLREKVLIIEDDDQVAKMTEQVLAGDGYQVSLFPNASKALKLFEKGRSLPALVITDQVMPGISGLELARWLANRYPRIPVIIMSGYSDFQNERDIGDNVTFLAKPYNLTTLRKTVRKLLGQV